MNIVYCNQIEWERIQARKVEAVRMLANGSSEDKSLLNIRRSARRVGDSWLVDIYGVLACGKGRIHELCGGTLYQTIKDEILAMPADCDELVLVCNSHGGDAQGVFELADLISHLKVSTVAYISEFCCSAAYFLACACDKVVATNTALVGSIGTVLTLFNGESDFIAISNKEATYKHPETPLSDDAKAYYQDLCDQMAMRFVSFVNGQRSVHPDVFSGKVYTVEAALELGLIDDVLPWTAFADA